MTIPVVCTESKFAHCRDVPMGTDVCICTLLCRETASHLQRKPMDERGKGRRKARNSLCAAVYRREFSLTVLKGVFPVFTLIEKQCCCRPKSTGPIKSTKKGEPVVLPYATAYFHSAFTGLLVCRNSLYYTSNCRSKDWPVSQAGIETLCPWEQSLCLAQPLPAPAQHFSHFPRLPSLPRTGKGPAIGSFAVFQQFSADLDRTFHPKARQTNAGALQILKKPILTLLSEKDKYESFPKKKTQV